MLPTIYQNYRLEERIIFKNFLVESEKLLGKTAWLISENLDNEYYVENGKLNRKSRTLFSIKKVWISKNNIWKMMESWKDGRLFFVLEEAKRKLDELNGGVRL